MLWRSTDGLDWQATPVPVPNAEDGVEASVTSASVVEDTLVILLYVRNRLDSVPVLAEMPLG